MRINEEINIMCTVTWTLIRTKLNLKNASMKTRKWRFTYRQLRKQKLVTILFSFDSQVQGILLKHIPEWNGFFSTNFIDCEAYN